MSEAERDNPPPTQPAGEALPGSASRRRFLPRWFKPVLTLLGIVVLCLVCFGLGSYYANAKYAVPLSKHILSAMGFIAAVALVLMVLLLALKHWIVPRVGDSAKRLAQRAAEAVSRQDMPPLASLRASLPALREDAASLITAYFVGRAYWFTLAALAGILGAAITAAQLVVLIEQTEKLGQQNALITGQSELLAKQNMLVGLQTQIAAITNKADLDMAQAQRRYDEIGRILDESKSPAAQEYALLSLPDAMVMPVLMVDPTWKPRAEDKEPRTVTQYPNLRRLAERLVMFAKQPRITETAEGKEVPSGTVSTAICRALHRVGYGNDPEPKFGDCLWDLVYTIEGTANQQVNMADSPHLLLRDDPSPPGMHQNQVGAKDLRHLRRGQLRGANLQRSNLRQANLQEANLDKTSLQGADLHRASLHGADLGWADLQRADLTEAYLQGANLSTACLVGADLRVARLQGADLSTARLVGADLRWVSLEGANLGWASLQGAILSEASLEGAVLRKAKLQGVNLRAARLWGTDFSEADLGRGSFEIKANSVGSVGFWIDQPVSEGLSHTFELLAAVLARSDTGSGFVIDRDALSMKAAVWELEDRLRRAYSSSTLQKAFWRTREAAETAMKTAFGNDAVEFIKCIVPRPTTFKDATLDGVFIDQDTINGWPTDGTDIPPAELFKDAVKVPALIKEREENQFRLPNAAEFIKNHDAKPGLPPAATPSTPTPPAAEDGRSL